MGLDINATRFLLYARTQGVSFAKTAMLGRQELHVDAPWLKKLLTDYGYAVTNEDVDHLLSANGRYAEPLLHMLGAEEICSFDADDYEAATDIHDFNVPIGDHFKGRFTLVLDAGSLEHVFDFPVAIKNCMEILAPGGHFVGISPANNFFGHGFYQFSPEVFFRVFASENGFAVLRMILCEVSPMPKWFEVVDPQIIGERVKLVNARRTYLMVLAQKAAAVPILTTRPQQSDYLELWQSHGQSRHGLVREGTMWKVKRSVPFPLKVVYHMMRDAWERGRQSFASRYNERFFRRMWVP